MKTMVLMWKWTVSKARDTYGYNICSLYVDDLKVSSCNGGGYDMKGTALGEFLEKTYQKRLLKLHRRAGSRYSHKNGHNYKSLKPLNPGYSGHGELYGMTAYYERGHRKAERVSLDGACGFSSIVTIAEAIGLRLEYHGSAYTLVDRRV